jgi:hypothetical protein
MPVDLASKSLLLFPDDSSNVCQSNGHPVKLSRIANDSGIPFFHRWSTQWLANWKPSRDRGG